MSRTRSLSLAFFPCILLASLTRAGELSSTQSARMDATATPKGLADSDWSSICAAYEAGRHGVVAVDGAHRARNPGQRWTTHFDGRGFTTRPDEGDWAWGLELVRWGFEGHERDVAGEACSNADGQRLTYEWDASLSEWYVNDTRGLEHGYTVNERPEGEGTLTFALGVRGELRADVQPDGRGVSFVNDEGAGVLTYAGLEVFDADGRALPTGIELAPDGLRLLVDERGASYPLTIDPIAQQAYVKASNTDLGDSFGHSVAISGNTLLVGAPGESSNATGVNGDQASNGTPVSGAAYVFVRSGSTWSQQAYLKASNTGASDRFGYSVAISGDTLVVGADQEDSNATGVNGDETSNSALEAGAAYVFVRSGTTWSQQAYLKASNTGAGDRLGVPATISGDTVVVGAGGEDSNATGVNGDQVNNSTPESGAAYVFVRSGTTWSHQAYLKASNTDAYDAFGKSVGVCGDTVVVGAPFEASNATGVNGDQASNSAPEAGAAYVFVRGGTTWSQQTYLKASNTGALDNFGNSIAISVDTIVVGAWQEDSNATGVDGDQTSNGAPASGAAYVFVRSGSVWSQQAYLKASNTGASDYFGFSIALSGDTVVVGAWGEDSNATGVNGDQSSNSAAYAGAAYVLVRSGTTWGQAAYLKASNSGAGDFFGWSAAIWGDSVVVGAYGEDSSASGVNGDQSNDNASEAGAAYVFLLPTPITSYCFGDGTATACPCGNAGAAGNGCASSVNPAGGNLAVSGSASVSADTLTLSGTGMPNGTALYFQGTLQVNGGLGVAFGDGLRCAGGTIVRLGAKTNSSGASQYPSAGDASISVRGLIPPTGGTRTYQVWYRNAAAFCTSSTFNLTNGLEVLWSP